MIGYGDRISFLENLQKELGNLPGEAAHLDMLPFRKLTSEALHKKTDYRLSAVLILLYYQENAPYFVLTERHEYGGKHSGQISLPGGKTEPEDRNTGETALRETQEEIGVHSDQIELLGNLTEVYIPVSNFLIHPYIGHTADVPNIYPDPREVKSVIHCSLDDLLNDGNRVVTKFQNEKGYWMKNIPAFNFQEKMVWGATAIILNELKFMLRRMA